jgi:hypothetical protein
VKYRSQISAKTIVGSLAEGENDRITVVGAPVVLLPFSGFSTFTIRNEDSPLTTRHMSEQAAWTPSFVLGEAAHSVIPEDSRALQYAPFLLTLITPIDTQRME